MKVLKKTKIFIYGTKKEGFDISSEPSCRTQNEEESLEESDRFVQYEFDVVSITPIGDLISKLVDNSICNLVRSFNSASF